MTKLSWERENVKLEQPIYFLQVFLSLLAFPIILLLLFFMSVDVFLLHLIKLSFWVGFPAYFSNHSLFSMEHIFVRFNKFPYLVCWCTVIHFHRPQGAYSFLKSKIGFYLCAVKYVHSHGTSSFKSHRRRLCNVQLIPYPRGLQQKAFNSILTK